MSKKAKLERGSVEITTATVELKTLTVSGKQMTISVFRQLPTQAVIWYGTDEKQLTRVIPEEFILWGLVRSCSPACKVFDRETQVRGYKKDRRGSEYCHYVTVVHRSEHLHVVYQSKGVLYHAMHAENPLHEPGFRLGSRTAPEYDLLVGTYCAEIHKLKSLPQLFITV